MGKGRINITKEGDFHFSFKAHFLTMKIDMHIEKRQILVVGFKTFPFYYSSGGFKLQRFLFILISFTSDRVNRKHDLFSVYN